MTRPKPATGVETDPSQTTHDPQPSEHPSVELEGLHFHLTQVTLFDHTDRHNQLVTTRQWMLHPLDARNLKLQGNLFIVENPFTGAGKLFVKCAPLPHPRQLPQDQFDFEVTHRRAEADGKFRDFYTFTLFQTGPADLETWKVIDYTGGAHGRTRALHRWQQSLRPPTHNHTTPKFMSNTWGDRHRDACISHDFMIREIKRGAALGVDVIMIDDGWQKGRSSNSAEAADKNGVWEGFWQVDPNFWTPCPQRFPEGLEPLVELAKSHGVELGLWYANDSTHDFANWQKDAAQVLKLHKTYGVNFIKFDAITTKTPTARRNLRQMINTVIEGSNGEIVCDLDITASVRPGYFGEMTLGVIFVENRYTDWHNYWPHCTLRNLWELTQFVDPRRLRMELLNNERNQHLYTADPLAPGRYPPATLFAITMFANPLGFFENSNLSEAYLEEVASLVQVWKTHRDQIFAGDILPIGDVPDGLSWTGFCSCHPDHEAGYALIFNELSPNRSTEIQLPPSFSSLERLHGHGHAEIQGTTLNVSMDEPFQYLLMKLHK